MVCLPGPGKEAATFYCTNRVFLLSEEEEAGLNAARAGCEVRCWQGPFSGSAFLV